MTPSSRDGVVQSRAVRGTQGEREHPTPPPPPPPPSRLDGPTAIAEFRRRTKDFIRDRDERYDAIATPVRESDPAQKMTRRSASFEDQDGKTAREPPRATKHAKPKGTRPTRPDSDSFASGSRRMPRLTRRNPMGPRHVGPPRTPSERGSSRYAPSPRGRRNQDSGRYHSRGLTDPKNGRDQHGPHDPSRHFRRQPRSSRPRIHSPARSPSKPDRPR